MEFVRVATSTNMAYELVKYAKEEPEYEVVDQSGPPPLPQDRGKGCVNLPWQSRQSLASPSVPPPAVAPSRNENVSQAPSNCHPPAVAPSEDGKGGIEKEAVYELIPGNNNY